METNVEVRSPDVDFDNVHTVRLVADGCGGQNKSTIVLTICLNWLIGSPQHLNRIEIVYPITGHSFMPSDRVFGCIEGETKTKETIVTLAGHHDSFAAHGTVKKLGVDLKSYDWKSEAKGFIKDAKDLHFKISRIRRLILTKDASGVKVQGEMTYLHEIAQALKVNKPGKVVSRITPTQLKPGVKVQPAKPKDVKKLLKKHYGANWSEVSDLKWYKAIIDSNRAAPEETAPEEDQCGCANNDINDNDGYDEVLEIVTQTFFMIIFSQNYVK